MIGRLVGQAEVVEEVEIMDMVMPTTVPSAMPLSCTVPVFQSSATQAYDENHGGQDQVRGLGVINLCFDQHADARGGDDAEEQDADAAHDRSGDGLDESRELADEGQDDGDDGRATVTTRSRRG